VVGIVRFVGAISCGQRDSGGCRCQWRFGLVVAPGGDWRTVRPTKEPRQKRPETPNYFASLAMYGTPSVIHLGAGAPLR